MCSKRVYAHPESTDGMRILVDRLWPRGISKERASVDEWLRDIAPSDALRTWFGHKSGRWPQFQIRYREELRQPDKQALLRRLRSLMHRSRVTLLYATRDEVHNNAAVLVKLLSRKRQSRTITTS